MKIQNILRTQVVVMAIGAAFLLAGATHAQEIDNPSFDEGPNSVPFSQPEPASTSGHSKLISTESHATASSAPAVVTTKPLVAQAGVISEEPSIQAWAIAMMTGCFLLSIFVLRTEARRRGAHRGRNRVGMLSSKAAIS
jgi:hypothetical protein